MFRHPPIRRVFTVALGVAVCLAGACASTQPRHGDSSEPGAASPAESSTRELTLSAEQERLAAAHAQFAAGLSTELRNGLEAALPAYEAALQLDPKNTALAIRLAQVSISRKDFAGAKDRLDSAAKANPGSADPWLWLGIVHKGTDNSAEALNSFEQALKINPRHIPSLAALIEMLLQRDALDEVVAQLDKAWRQDSQDGQFWLGIGKIYAQVIRQKPSLAGRLGETRPREAFTKAVELAPRDPESLLQLADAQLEAGNFTAAADAFSRLLVVRPDLPLREKLAKTFVQADQKDKAIKIYREMIKRNPTEYTTYNSLAELHEEAEQNDEAIANYQQSLVLNPDQPEVYLRLAVLQLEQKKFDKALGDLAAARLKFPTVFQIPYVTGLVHSEQKNYAKAVAAFADAEALLKDDADEMKPSSAFFFSYGAACERSGDIAKAERLFQKSLEINPRNHAAANYLGYMWADKGVRLEEAHELIKQAVELEPDNGAYLDSLGWVLFKLGKTEEALPYLQKAAAAVKDDAVVHDHLADALLKLGRRDEAIKHLKRAVEMEPENKDFPAKLRKLTGE
jgi:tetratricopeptide (TPR) repeat protein